MVAGIPNYHLKKSYSSIYVVARKEGRHSMHKRRRKYHSKGTRKKGITAVPCLVIVLLIITGMATLAAIARNHYMVGTIIQGVDCSKLTVEEAKERIETAEVTLKFFNSQEYYVQGTEIGRHIVDTSELQEILEAEHEDGSVKEFTLSSEAFSLDTDKMSTYLQEIQELDSKNMRMPKNARLKRGADGLVEIVPEKLGSTINFDDAIGLAQRELQAGECVIDFSTVTNVYPDIKSSDSELVSKMEEMNKVLSAKIELELRDGSLYTLDNEITRRWVKADETWGVRIEIDENLTKFVEGLNEQVQSLGETIEFETPSHEVVTVSVVGRNRDCIEQEIEFDELKSELQQGKTVRRSPNYKILNVQSEWKSYIYVSKVAQMIYVFEDTEIIRSMPCITGLKGTSRETHTGLFYLILKEPDKYFKLGGHADYWMMYNYWGEGFHDANWQAKEWFTPTGYVKHGSHGCVNMMDEPQGSDDASWLYSYITSNIPIIVH